MAVKLILPGVVPAAIPQYPEHVTAWKSYTDPPVSWYKTFSSMQYKISPVIRSERMDAYLLQGNAFRLTPVVGRPVYTFDEIESFIEASRQFTVALFTTTFT